jgi:hypothetical protein
MVSVDGQCYNSCNIRLVSSRECKSAVVAMDPTFETCSSIQKPYFFLLSNWPYLARLVLAHALLVASAAWTWGVALRYRPGWGRTFSALPALVALALAPLLFNPATELLVLAAVAYLSERLPATKVRAFLHAGTRIFTVAILLLPSTWLGPPHTTVSDMQI